MKGTKSGATGFARRRVFNPRLKIKTLRKFQFMIPITFSEKFSREKKLQHVEKFVSANNVPINSQTKKWRKKMKYKLKSKL